MSSRSAIEHVGALELAHRQLPHAAPRPFGALRARHPTRITDIAVLAHDVGRSPSDAWAFQTKRRPCLGERRRTEPRWSRLPLGVGSNGGRSNDGSTDSSRVSIIPKPSCIVEERVPKLSAPSDARVAERAVYRFVAGLAHPAGDPHRDPVGELAFTTEIVAVTPATARARSPAPSRPRARPLQPAPSSRRRSPAPGQLSGDGNARGRGNDDELRQAFFGPPTGERFLQAADDEATQTCGRNQRSPPLRAPARSSRSSDAAKTPLYAESGRDRSGIDRERNAAPPGLPQRAVAGITREQERARLERLLNEACQGVIGRERQSGDQRLIDRRARRRACVGT